MTRLSLWLCLILPLAASSARLIPARAAQPAAIDLGMELLTRPAVKSAITFARAQEPTVVEDQIRLCEIPAPPFKETARAEAFKGDFERLGLRNVRIDAVGNVIGERPGRAATPAAVISAHLDTVFPEGTDVRVRREGTLLHGPGIGDDCRGLAVLLGIIRALDAAKVETHGPLVFVGTVGEEGLGDLRGVKQLFASELKGGVSSFVSIDGAGLGVTHVGVGSHRYRVTYSGPGGHSYGAFGNANPIHALGRAIARISAFNVPADPKTTFNVGRIGGGTSVNSIAFEAWMEVDMRSSDAQALASLDAQFQEAVKLALAEENARWEGRGKLSVDVKLVGDRAAGRTPRESPLVVAALSVTRALGLPISVEEGSTDSNVPMGLGVPAVTIDGGGSGRGAHSLHETFDTRDSWQGTVRAMLLAIAMSEG
jgi:acetylornithine deacetylase/succinyl-diaminopimelate desuccinylase-like protein